MAQGEQWKKTTLKTALLYPGVLFAIFFTLNILVRCWVARKLTLRV